jgi:protein disulfide-isomerase
MRKLITFLAVAFIAVASISAGEGKWLTDLDEAKALAKKENKVVLLDFTGSDWCGYCIKLKNDVFSTPAFQEWAEKNAVLVEVDFPSKKKLPKKLEKANKALQKQYKIEGYPTIVILDAEGKKLGQEEGYDGKGPEPYLKSLNAIVAKARK